MMTPPETPEAQTIARHPLAYLRSLDKKVDLLLDTSQRHGERLAHLERNLGETRRVILELKSNIATLENKVLSSHAEILGILHRLDSGPTSSEEETKPEATDSSALRK